LILTDKTNQENKKREEVMDDSSLLKNFNKIDNLPTIPGVAMKILEAVRSEETSLNVIAGILCKDPPLTAKILGLINSAFYNLPSKITSISHAVKLLGINTVKKVALTFSLVRSFSNPQEGPFNYGLYWRNSLAAAVASRLLAGKVLPQREDDAFTLGLLQDIGILAFNEAMAKQYSLVIHQREKEHCPYQEAEERIIGFNHQMLGGFLAKKWGLPEIFYIPIEFHHQPETLVTAEPEIRELTRILYLSSLVVEFFNHCEKYQALGLLHRGLEEYGYSDRISSKDLIEEVHEQTKQISSLFDVTINEDEYTGIIDQARNALIQLSNEAILEMAGQQDRIRGLQEKADRDSLTGLYNYRRFHELLEEKMEKSRHAGIPLTLVLADIDFFKRVNDTHGHPAGDYVLETLGKLLAQILRSSDVLARHGGEEFGLILPFLPLEKALQVVERLRRAVEGFPFDYEGQPIPLTMSFGLAHLPPGGKTAKDTLIKMADQTLYQSKKTGRNKLSIWVDQGAPAGDGMRAA
jgi:diguanylate cyclase (GGDEF)-like protein